MTGRQAGFWDVEHRLRQLSERGDPLEKLAATVDFEIFRAELVAAQGPRDRSKGGRPPFDPVLKFRMLVLQAMHGLSPAQTEFLVTDRLSWMRFCGLGPGDAAPDANTLWDFREALIAAGALDALFAKLDRAITEAGYLPMAGQIVAATLAAAPRQRNTEAEKARIKAAAPPSERGAMHPIRRRRRAFSATRGPQNRLKPRLPEVSRGSVHRRGASGNVSSAAAMSLTARESPGKLCATNASSSALWTAARSQFREALIVTGHGDLAYVKFHER